MLKSKICCAIINKIIILADKNDRERLIKVMNISVTKTTTPKVKPQMDNLPFGKYFSDHMFVMDYEEGKGWYDPRIVPYAPFEIEPSAMVFHYAQEIFEGLKAYKAKDGHVRLFRPKKNFERMNVSAERIAIPQIDEELCVEALKQLVELDRDWIPEQEGASLYIRPFIIATDPFLGVRPSNTYKFFIICSPSGLYYPEGLNPVKIYVEGNYVRAVRGGTGFTKTGGNYAGSIRAQIVAHEKGYSQVLWLDGVEQKYIEEVGSMNIFFKIDGEVVTPALNGSILSGITRMSTIELLKKWGIPVSERKISINELYEAYKDNKFEECFGTGTAAIISPVGELRWEDKVMNINDNKIGEVTQRIFDTITGIQTGSIKDEMGWVTIID